MQQKLLHLSGIGFVVLVFVAIGIGGGTPGTDESAAEVASFYDQNEVRQFVSVFAFSATVPFLILFVVGLGRAMGDAVWGQVAIAGAILAGGAILMTAAIHFALSDAATGGEVVQEALVAINFVDGSTWVAFNAGFGVMMLGAAGLLLSAGLMRWLGWIALVLGVALFIPFADFVALLLTLVWIVVTSVLLARGNPKAASVAAPGTA